MIGAWDKRRSSFQLFCDVQQFVEVLGVCGGFGSSGGESGGFGCLAG